MVCAEVCRELQKWKLASCDALLRCDTAENEPLHLARRCVSEERGGRAGSGPLHHPKMPSQSCLLRSCDNAFLGLSPDAVAAAKWMWEKVVPEEWQAHLTPPCTCYGLSRALPMFV